MSLVPLLFSDWWEDLDRPHRLLDQNFGLGLNPEQLLAPRRIEQYTPRRCPMMYYRPWAELLREDDGGTSTVQSDKDKFQVSTDFIIVSIFFFFFNFFFFLIFNTNLYLNCTSIWILLLCYQSWSWILKFNLGVKSLIVLFSFQ